MENENKFTDEEIIKALECCNRNGTCSKCPFDRASFEHEPDCASVMTANALDLINRQKAEVAYWMDAAANAKKEAVKEFAERLKKYYASFNGKTAAVGVEYHIDQIAKEMLGETS